MKPTIHASCVALGGKGVLLLGDSGVGKSDLALRLIDQGAKLVADDRTELSVVGGKLMARAPRTIAGLLEVRGIGLVTLPHLRQAEIALAVRLGKAGKRLPEPQFFLWESAPPVPLLVMDGREASAPAKIRLVVGRRGAFTETRK
jgi:hypothetical protein